MENITFINEKGEKKLKEDIKAFNPNDLSDIQLLHYCASRFERYKNAWTKWYYVMNGKLMKNQKPCIPGDQVHLKDKNGCFTVVAVCHYCFFIQKDRAIIPILWSRFKCQRGHGDKIELSVNEKIELLDMIRLIKKKKRR